MQRKSLERPMDHKRAYERQPPAFSEVQTYGHVHSSRPKSGNAALESH